MRRLALAFLATTALVAPALADLNTPVPSAEDGNMKTIAYSPGARVRLVNTINRSLVITFGPDEQIKRVIFGDDGETWEGPDPEEIKQVSLKNNLPLWARKVGYTTLQVITQRPGAPDRPYQFAVEARNPPLECAGKPTACDDPAATYGLTFTYPQDEREAKTRAAAEARQRWLDAAPARAQRREEALLVAARERLEVDFFSGGSCRNWQYAAEGNAEGRALLVPDKLADNGQETAFQYAGNRQIPSFFTVAPDGKSEQPVRPAIRNGDTAILPLTAPEFHVRLGDAVLYVYNRAFNAVGCDPGTFTTRPDVVRGLRRQPLQQAAR